MPEAQSTLAVFRNPAFRSLWFATLASNFGGLVQAVGAAWLMTSLTSSAGMVALGLVAQIVRGIHYLKPA